MRGIVWILCLLACSMAATVALAQAPEEPSDGLLEFTTEERQAYRATLVDAIAQGRALVHNKLVQRVEAKADARLDLMADVLLWFALSGLLLLLMPLFLRRKYPGKTWMLFKHSAMAALMFVGAIVVLAMLLLVFRGFQAGVSEFANPQLQIVDRSFDALHNSVDDVLELGPVLIEAPLAALLSGEAEDVPVALFENAKRFKADFGAFANIAKMFSWVKGALGLLPIFLAIVVVGLFLLSMKDLILTIVRLPDAVASGEATAGQVFKRVLKNIGAESLATLCLIAALIVVTILTGIAMSYIAGPAAESLIAHVLLNQLYVFVELDASTALVYVSLGGNILFMLLTLLSLMLASIFLLGRLRKVFNARFHGGVPMSHQRRFWRWGPLAFGWVLVLPWLFALAATPLVSALIDVDSGTEITWPMVLGAGTMVMVFGFLLVYWVLRGFAAIDFLRTCPIVQHPEAAS